MARLLARRSARQQSLPEKEPPCKGCGGGSGGGGSGDEDSDGADGGVCAHPPGWRNKANLRMYTILDKIF